MIFKKTKLNDALIIEPEKHQDERGFFARTWCRREFEKQGITADPMQSNVAFNRKKNILRGMHFQKSPWEETKLVRCTRGAIYDVIIDLRPASPTYKQWMGVELTQDNYLILFVPEGFAHGYQTLTEFSEITYQVSEFYQPRAEAGIRWNDPAFNIQWPASVRRFISEKDRNWPDFRDSEFMESQEKEYGQRSNL